MLKSQLNVNEGSAVLYSFLYVLFLYGLFEKYVPYFSEKEKKKQVKRLISCDLNYVKLTQGNWRDFLYVGQA